MSDARIQGYARALFEIARAEGTLDEVEDELFRFARSYESSDALRNALTDEHIPAEKRQAIVEDLLGPKVSRTSVALVSMVVAAGHAVGDHGREHQCHVVVSRTVIHVRQTEREPAAKARARGHRDTALLQPQQQLLVQGIQVPFVDGVRAVPKAHHVERGWCEEFK